MKVTICGRTDEEKKDQIGRECVLREHTLSEALDIIIGLGLPIYLTQFPPVLQRVEEGSQMPSTEEVPAA